MKLNTYKRTCSYIAGLALLAIVTFTQQSCNSDEAQGKLEKLATEMNSSLPMAVDGSMRLEKVDAKEGRTFEYHFTVLLPVNNDSLKQQLTTQYTENAKSENMAAFRADGIKLVYYYKDESGKDLFNIKINTADYK